MFHYLISKGNGCILRFFFCCHHYIFVICLEQMKSCYRCLYTCKVISLKRIKILFIISADLFKSLLNEAYFHQQIDDINDKSKEGVPFLYKYFIIMRREK
ncbi:Hypothetical protein SRAE_X000107400 [Strongyloides ratti]|uniref:Uncharacterized protein n=1 Tax=Strongyloides ratti TaxID=34506 RepID=A0A090KPM7_STRRB|nr:Hypothetical protein SRAE_X000107400 [Strongyloides ratti]CEF59324.1 Hypothetical protein SRAE_X000107400 [Strongyloides ratti]